jgi:hypothetical protein
MAAALGAGAAPVEISGMFSGAQAKGGAGETRFLVSEDGVASLAAAAGPVLLRNAPLPGGLADITLEPFSPFADDATIVLKGEHADVRLPLPDADYFRGETTDGQAAFLRVSSTGDLFGMVGGDGEAVVLKSQDGEGYSRPAQGDEQEAICPGGIVVADTPEPMPWEKKADKGGLSEFRILVDMENRLLRSIFAGDETAAIAYVGDLFGVVSAVYQRDAGISLNIGDLVLWGTPATFELPLVSSVSPTYNNLLDAYRTFDNTRTGYQRHLSHLLSLKLPSYGSTVGLAFVGSLCSNSAKQGSSTLNGKATAFDANTNELDPMTVAHEIGHNFNCSHTNTSTIMDAVSSNFLSFSFDAGSIALIQNRVASAPCSSINFEQCAPDSLYGQRPVSATPAFGITKVSDIAASNVEVFDEFSGATAPIGRVRWWEYEGGCTRAPQQFEITFYPDDSGEPGVAQASFVLEATPTDSPLSLESRGLLEYEATLPETVSLTSGWVSIVGTGDADCSFEWATSIVGDGDCLTSTGGGAFAVALGDMAFCLMPSVDVDIFPGLECPAGTVYSQPVDLGGSPFSVANRFASNEGTQRYYESFTGVTGAFDRVDWWGWELDATDLECTRTPSEFEVSFFPAGNSPGTAIETYTIVPTRTAVPVDSIPTLFQYSFNLPEPLSLTEGIVQIRGITDTACKFSWALSNQGDARFSFMTTGPGFSFFNDLNGAFCFSSTPLPEGEGEGIAEGEGVVEGVVEGEGAQEGEGTAEGEGVLEGEGEGLLEGEGSIDGEGVAEGEGAVEGEGAIEGEGEGLLEGEGEGGIEGILEGEGQLEGEGVLEGEGEGEGLLEGEGISEGEGAVEGEGAQEGEGVSEGEGEGVLEDPYEALLFTFASAEISGDALVSLAEIVFQLPGFTQEMLDDADANGDGLLSVAELLEANGVHVLNSADSNGDFLLSLNELLRVIQFYNAGGYACATNPGATEDGFEPRTPQGTDPACFLHALDANQDNTLTLSELLRGIQLFNFAGYQFCDGFSEDNFCNRP